MLASDMAIDYCLVSQLMLCLIPKVTHETKSSFRGKNKNPMSIAHQHYLSVAPELSILALPINSEKIKAWDRQMQLLKRFPGGGVQFLLCNQDPKSYEKGFFQDEKHLALFFPRNEKLKSS